jgi:hypothetical protein
MARTRIESTNRFEESLEQQAVVQWASIAVVPDSHPLWGQRIGDFLFAIPNGSHLAGDGRQRAMKAGILKREGMSPGVHDLFLMLPSGPYHGLFIEMKRAKGGRVTPDQRSFAQRATEAGYGCVLARGSEQAVEAIIVYLNGKTVPVKLSFPIDK